MSSKINFLDLPLDAVTMKEALQKIKYFISEKAPHIVLQVNAANIVKSRSDEELKKIYQTADLVTVDGMAIVYSSKLLNRPFPEMVSGVFLMEELVREAAIEGYKLYFLGARREVIEKTVSVLKNRYPSLKIAGWHHGYFTPEEEPMLVKEIASAKPHILFVGMSTPLKEKWISRHLKELNVPVCIGVGGSFDVVAGLYKVAPSWMRKCCLEWFYRFLQEPRRMGKRYAKNNPIFIYLVLREWIKQI